jgi:hypothetical protein
MEQETKCSKCNKTVPGKTQILTLIFGFYLLGSAIYGTIHIVKDLIRFFS